MTSESHVATELLIDYLEERLGPEAEQEIGSHVDSCPRCGTEIDTLRELITELEKPEIWGESGPEWTMSQSTEASRRLSAFADRLEEEEITGRRIVEVLLDLPEQEWRDGLGEMSQTPTLGLVNTLLASAHDRIHAQPALSLSLARTASSVAERLDERFYGRTPVYLARAAGFKEQANALRMLGRYSNVMPMLDAAEHLLEDIPGAELERAALDYIRGTVLRELGEFDDALHNARTAAETSLVFGDIRRHIHYRMLETATLKVAGDPVAAREITLELLRTAERMGDDQTVALLLGNVGNISLQLGDEPTATIFLRKAATLYDGMRMVVPAIRMRWTLAALLARDQRMQEAEPKLREVADAFAALTLYIEEALVSLELAEIYLTTGRAAEAGAICTRVIGLLQKEGVAPAAMTALAFLQEATRLRPVDRDTIRQAYSFLQQAPHQAPLLYLHPPSS